MATIVACFVAFAAAAQTTIVKNGITDLAYSRQADNNVFFTGKYQGKPVNLVRTGVAGSGKWTIYTGPVADRVRLTFDDRKGLQEILAMDKGQRITLNQVGQERVEYRFYAPDRSFVIGSVLYRKNDRWLQGMMKTEAFAGYPALTGISDVTSKFTSKPTIPAAKHAEWLKDWWQGFNLISTAHAGTSDDLIKGFFSSSATDARNFFSPAGNEIGKGMLIGAAAFAGKLVATSETVAVGSAVVVATPFLVAVGTGVAIGLAADKVKNWLDAKNLGGTASASDLYNRLVAGTRFSNEPAPEAPAPEVAGSAVPGSSPTSLLDMADKLDSLDKQDFNIALDDAANCTRARNFSCTDVQIAKAEKLAGNSHDRKAVMAARETMDIEKSKVAEEARLRREEEERQRIALARQQEQQRQQEVAASESGGFQWGKAAALLGGSAIGGLTHLTSEAQVKVVTGILKDSMAGQGGVNNFKGATNSSLASSNSQSGRNQSSTQTSAGQTSTACPTSGGPQLVSSTSAIPAVCVNGREQNYAYAETSGVPLDTICNEARNGDNISNDHGRNISICYCAANAFKQNGETKPMTCWVFYDKR